MLKKLLLFFGLIPDKEESKILKAIKIKNKRLKKYCGKIIIGKKFGIKDEFETKKGRISYENELRRKNKLK